MRSPHKYLPIVRTGTIFLVVLMFFAALLRYFLPEDWHVWLLKPFYGEYVPFQTDVLASLPIQEFLHRVGGVVYLLIGLLQFSKKFRRKRPRLHRNLGKVFLVLSVVLGVGGILFSILVPLSGLMETVPVVFFGGLFLVFTAMAYLTARRKQFLEHREWVIRNFAIGLGVGSVRVSYAAFLNFSSLNLEDVFTVSIWLGFTLNLVLAEVWIHLTRKKAARSRGKGKALGRT